MKNIRVKGPTYMLLKRMKFMLDKPITIVAQEAIESYFRKVMADVEAKSQKKEAVESEGKKRASSGKNTGRQASSRVSD